MGLYAEYEAAKEWLKGFEDKVEAFVKAEEDKYRAWWAHHHGGEVPVENIEAVRAKALDDLKAKESQPIVDPLQPEPDLPEVKNEPIKPDDVKVEADKTDKPAEDKAEK